MKQVTCTLTLSVVLEVEDTLTTTEITNLIKHNSTIDIDIDSTKVNIVEVSDIIDITEVNI